MATVVVLVLGTIAVGIVDAPARSIDRTTSTNPWLPDDGISTAGRTDDGPATTTSAFFAVPQATQSLPTSLGATLIGTLEHDLATTVWRRTVATPTDDAYEVYTTDPDIRLLATSAAPVAGYVGGILLLPRDAHPGARWRSSGTTIGPDAITWQAEFTATAAAEPDCLATEGALTVDGTRQPAGRYRIAQVWCLDRGLVRDTWTGPDSRTRTWTATGPSEQPDPRIRTTDADAVAGGPPRGRAVALAPVSLLPGADPEPLSGSPSGPPLLTGSGLVVIRSGADLVVLTPDSDSRAVVRHRLHPGASPTAVGVFGDVVLSATTARELVAHAASTGRVLWRSPLEDAAHPTIARLTDDTVVVALTSGEVRALDLRTGTALWRATSVVGQQFPASIADTASGRAVLLAASTGTVELRDARTGRVHWTWRADLAVESVVLGRDRAWVLTDVGLHGIDPRTGTVQVLRRAPTSLPALMVDSVLVLARPEGVRAIDADGRDLWHHREECLTTMAAPAGVLCWQTGRVVLLDAVTGRVRADHALAPYGTGQLAAAVSGGAVWWRVSRLESDSWVVHRWSV